MTDTPSSLSLRDRYLNLADGKTLQWQCPNSSEWVDYDPAGYNIASNIHAWRVKPEPSVSGVVDNLTLRRLQELVAHAGAKPLDTLQGLLSQLSNICAGYTDHRKRITDIARGNLSSLTPDQTLVVGHAASVRSYTRAQALCTRLGLGPIGGHLVDILCDRVEKDLGLREDVRFANAKAGGAEALRSQLILLVKACGGDANNSNSDAHIIDAATQCVDAARWRHTTPEQAAMAVVDALKAAFTKGKS